jgi:hypothetical protein
MGLRWYSTVIDSNDVATLSRWWAETLDYRIVYEAPDEVVIVPAYVDHELIQATPWERVGPGLVFVSVDESKPSKNRIHLDLAPHTTDDRDKIIAALLARGAQPVDVGQSDDVSWTVLADPEGNEFCVLSSRDA